MIVYRLLVSCPDRPGIIAAVSRYLYEAGANIIHSDQHSSDPSGGEFFLRMEFTAEGRSLEELRDGFEEVHWSFDMDWRIEDAGEPKRLVVMVSRLDHCLLDLLWRTRRGELNATIGCVVSNHPDTRQDVESFGIPFHHIPVTPETKPEAERELLKLIGGRCEAVVLARYMQILSGELLRELSVPVINVHHSLLPAFPGAGPYEQARERGVKLIGATAHYVTEELDAGPIIEQSVSRVSHRDGVDALKRVGAGIERDVLARAVRWHCEDRVVRHGTTTVVF
jgi:formyltetrahydrofolate deformylase